jgi:hypothetical protein
MISCHFVFCTSGVFAMDKQTQLPASAQSSLTWLADQQFQEQRSLRAAEDQLFNWSTSLFVAGLGALTGLRGLADAVWSWQWRMILIGAVAVIIGTIIAMASLIHRNYNRNHDELSQLLSQINPARPTQRLESFAESQLFFYLRWGSLGIIGLVTITLIYLLG